MDKEKVMLCGKAFFKAGKDMKILMKNIHHLSSVYWIKTIKNNKTVNKNKKKKLCIKLHRTDFIHILKNIETKKQGVVYCSSKRTYVTILKIIEEY